MTSDEFLHNVLNDLRVELTEEFDKNFERNAFFDEAWPNVKHAVTRGSLMQRTGALRGSTKSQVDAGGLNFSSSLPYADIHNQGGILTVTENMKKFFWAMYYKASGAVTTTKGGKASNSKRNVLLSGEAAYWKSLALMKVGAKLIVPKRQFIGQHPVVDTLIREVVDENIQEFADSLRQTLQKIHS